jgi:2-methylisocitrate lyase-like PEP mutase family enzyme
LAVDVEATLKRSLAKRLKEKRILVAPGVFDMVSLRLADAMRFEALYITGYGVVASQLGLPDAGLATYTEMVGRVGAMAGIAATPLIADGDTGYGGLLNIRRTVRGYEAAGAAAIQLEDQEFPKKCGHTPGRRVVAIEDMRRRIEVAIEARSDPEFLVVARTDARSSLGLDEALRRGEAYVKAGADILFIESPESESEMARIGRGFDVPSLANMVEGGRTPAACAQAGGTGLSHCDLSGGGAACRGRRPATRLPSPQRNWRLRRRRRGVLPLRRVQQADGFRRNMGIRTQAR